MPAKKQARPAPLDGDTGGRPQEGWPPEPARAPPPEDPPEEMEDVDIGQGGMPPRSYAAVAAAMAKTKVAAKHPSSQGKKAALDARTPAGAKGGLQKVTSGPKKAGQKTAGTSKKSQADAAMDVDLDGGPAGAPGGGSAPSGTRA